MSSLAKRYFESAPYHGADGIKALGIVVHTFVHDAWAAIWAADEASAKPGAAGEEIQARLSPAFLARSSTFTEMAAFIKQARNMAPIWPDDGIVLATALRGLRQEKSEDVPRPAAARATGRMLELLTWFAREYLQAECGIEKPWLGDGRTIAGFSPYATPITAAAVLNETEMLRWMVAQGTPVEVLDGRVDRSPLVAAFVSGSAEAFTLLLELGANPFARYAQDDAGAALEGHYRVPLLQYILKSCADYLSFQEVSWHKDILANRRALLGDLLATLPPEGVRDSWYLERRETDQSRKRFPSKVGMVESVLESGDDDALAFIMKAGASLSMGEVPGPDNHGAACQPTAAVAVVHASHKGAHLLVETYGLLKDWRTRYSEEAQEAIVHGMAARALSFMENDATTADDDFAVLELFLKHGFNRVHDSSGANHLVEVLFLKAGYKETYGYPDEHRLLKVLRLFHAHGADLLHADASDEEIYRDSQLIHFAAMRAYPSTIEFAVKEVGCDPNAVCYSQSRTGKRRPLPGYPFASALLQGNVAVALRLLQDDMALKVTMPGIFHQLQPLVILFKRVDDDKEALPLLKLMLKRQSDILDPKYYDVSEGFEYPQGPIGLALDKNKLQCLELMLTTPGLQKVPEAINAWMWATSMVFTAVQMAVVQKAWGALSLLIKHGGKVTLKYEGPLPPGVAASPSAAELINTPGVGTTDRRVRLLVETAKKRELAEAERAKAATAAEGSTTNAFEDPEFAELAAKDGKKKQKKPKQKGKKKSKGKKRSAVASGAAGAGAAGEGESEVGSSDDDEDEDEELNEDEKLFGSGPSFDALKEQRAAKEAAGGAGKA